VKERFQFIIKNFAKHQELLELQVSKRHQPTSYSTGIGSRKCRYLSIINMFVCRFHHELPYPDATM